MLAHPLSATERLDLFNIGLMAVACAVAFVVPFELFLFSYAILGPLHYLTEISWLHDQKYYLPDRRYASGLLLFTALLTLVFFNFSYQLNLKLPVNMGAYVAYAAFFGTLVVVVGRTTRQRLVLALSGLILLLAIRSGSYFPLILAVFLPTLIHVYVFTGLFMLYGALKSRSRTGLLAVGVLALCPVLLVLFPDAEPSRVVTAYGREAYIGGERRVGFWGLNANVLASVFGVRPTTAGIDPMAFWLEQVFHSRAGVLLMRFIAFAYTYHYLNWFSKTRIIQWHNVPRARFAGVLALWAVSIGLYVWSYSLGLQWLYFLSYLHVLLEFPLNHTSAVGVVRLLRQRLGGGVSAQTVA
ncbi:MAG: hypothetical protein H7330_04680 [Hymenobacteraceae bacterium]|nr:hypothetical protein [Hymenobacteraceae bacterium]